MEQAEVTPAVRETADPAHEEFSEAGFSEEVREQLFIVEDASAGQTADAKLKAVLEAVIYITDEPLTLAQIVAALQQPVEVIRRLLDELTTEYLRDDRGLTIREVAGGFKMATKPEHHESIRAFVKNLKPPLKLSLPALETLAVIAYKQPVTAPEIMEIRGVQGVGVLKTLLDRKLIAASGRKQVVGKPILYKTTKEFLIQFGLKDVTELPTLKEFEDLGRLALSDAGPEETPIQEPGPQGDPPPASPPVEEPGTDPAPAHDPAPTTPGPAEDPQEHPVEEPDRTVDG
jgi:segregation and condensation protein B